MNSLSLRDKVFSFTQKKALFSAPCHIVVGVSGGADSMALLHMLLNWPENKLRVSAVHVHHGLRRDTADRDEQFVRDYCQTHNVQLVVYHEDVAAYAQDQGFTIEQAGRELRYARFEQARQFFGADLIATAHTASDQAETVLMRIIRGTGIDGLCGIPVVRGNICRPLLICARDEIERYCLDNAIPFVHDETNDDVCFTRNKIRHQVIPSLSEINPAIQDALLRLTEHAAEDSQMILAMAEDELSSAVSEFGYTVSAFNKVLPPVRKRMISLMMRKASVSSVEQKHIVAIEKALSTGCGQVFLPGGQVCHISQGMVSVFNSVSAQSIDEFVLSDLPCSVYWNNNNCNLRIVKCVGENVYNLFSNTLFDYDKIQGSLRLRRRRQQDAIRPVGRVGKSLKKLMNECNIPVFVRDSYPVLCDDLGVIMVPGYAVDERVKVTEDTKHLLVWESDDLTT